MTLNEKTAGNFGRGSAEGFVGEASQKSSTLIPEAYSFTKVVDEACGKLMDKQIQYSIRRIQEMRDRLSDIEKELDDFLKDRNNDEI